MNAIVQGIRTMIRKHRAQLDSSPLSQTSLKVTITDLLAEYELRHTFRNTGKQAIEAVYSFPVPLDAAFMGMEATLAGETRIATVMPATRATREYDEAISDGDSAVLLERLEPGMLCVNLGNLKPSEDGEIVLRFAAALGVADRSARFSLPLVHRPRYGRSRLDDVVRPDNDFAVEHPLEAEIRVRGLLADRPVLCATPGVRFQQDAGEMRLHIGQAMLDRDFVLNFELGDEPISQARWIDDGDLGTIGILSVSLPITAKEVAAQPRDICLLLDGSGSMSGDAILQSQAALHAVVDALGELDRIQVLRFGSQTVPLFRRPLRATERVKAALQELAATVDASLGGTEMNNALEHAITQLSGLDGATDQKVVVLVTDGAVNHHEIKKAQDNAVKKGIRVFVVAVGSSAGVDALLPLAEATGGTLERAVPAEPIEAGVMRQLRRAREQIVAIDIAWDRSALSLPMKAVYPGDAVVALAFIPAHAARTARVSIPATGWSHAFAADEIETSTAWRAWAGQQRYLHAAETEREAIALRHGLIADETSAILVKVRADGEKVEGLPDVVPVKHMMPEGMVARDRMALASSSLVKLQYSKRCIVMEERAFLDAPAFSRKNFYGEATPVLSPDRSESVGRVVCAALITLLLKSDEQFSRDRLFDAIDPKLHDEVRMLLGMFNASLQSTKGASQLLERLIEKGCGPALDDEQEARLAVLRQVSEV